MNYVICEELNNEIKKNTKSKKIVHKDLCSHNLDYLRLFESILLKNFHKSNHRENN